MSYLFTYFAFLLVDSLYLCQFITCLFLNKVWGDLIVFHNLLRTSFHPEHCGAKNPGLIMAYIAATLNPEILKKIPGPVRVGKKKSGSGRVAGTRQGLITTRDGPKYKTLRELRMLSILHFQVIKKMKKSKYCPDLSKF